MFVALWFDCVCCGNDRCDTMRCWSFQWCSLRYDTVSIVAVMFVAILIGAMRCGAVGSFKELKPSILFTTSQRCGDWSYIQFFCKKPPRGRKTHTCWILCFFRSIVKIIWIRSLAFFYFYFFSRGMTWRKSWRGFVRTLTAAAAAAAPAATFFLFRW